MTARKDPATLKRKLPNPPPTIKMKRGRPPVYNTDIDENVRRLCLLGLSDAEIAEYLCITPATMWNWDKLYPSFLSARAEGREKADAEVADSLRKRAIGYSHRTVKTTYVDAKVVREEHTELHYPSDTNAAALWLSNRQRGRWKLRPTEDDAGGDDGERTLNIRITGGLPDD
jgi:hypothetical protein